MLTRKQIADNTMSAYPDFDFVNGGSNPDDDSLGFMWGKCELCDDGHGGDRFAVTAIIPGETPDKSIEFAVCADCLYYVAYGEYTPEYDEEKCGAWDGTDNHRY